MDGDLFDNLSRKLANRRSRRDVLGLLGASLAGLLTGRAAAAAPKDKNPGGGKPVQDKPSKCYGEGSHCTNGKQCCSGICTNRQCAPEVVLVCEPGSTQACYTGPDGTEGIGICQAGTQTCLADGSGYGLCEGEVLPTTETCNGLDDDCNGGIDDGAICLQRPNATMACVGGECVLQACDAGYANCNGNSFDGCETTIASDVQNCGGCGTVCPPTGECRSGSCCISSGNPNLRNEGFPCCNAPSSLDIVCP